MCVFFLERERERDLYGKLKSQIDQLYPSGSFGRGGQKYRETGAPEICVRARCGKEYECGRECKCLEALCTCIRRGVCVCGGLAAEESAARALCAWCTVRAQRAGSLKGECVCVCVYASAAASLARLCVRRTTEGPASRREEETDALAERERERFW